MSQSPITRFPIADRESEKYLKKYYNALIGRADIKDALSELDKLTEEEVKMVTAQTFKLANDIKDGVKVVDDKMDQLIEGTFSAVISSQNVVLNLYMTRPRERESS